MTTVPVSTGGNNVWMTCSPPVLTIAPMTKKTTPAAEHAEQHLVQVAAAGVDRERRAMNAALVPR